jgi:hypothetical protein
MVWRWRKGYNFSTNSITQCFLSIVIKVSPLLLGMGKVGSLGGQRWAPEGIQGIQNIPRSAWVKTDIGSKTANTTFVETRLRAASVFTRALRGTFYTLCPPPRYSPPGRLVPNIFGQGISSHTLAGGYTPSCLDVWIRGRNKLSTSKYVPIHLLYLLRIT